MNAPAQPIRLDDVISGAGRARKTTARNVDGIRAVTTQLRVLALNAQIEATRAGAAGRGFGVVASEVKAVSLAVDRFADALSRDLGGEIAALESMTRAMAHTASSLRLVDLSLNAIELMDRNLYERTCDVRWWATDAAVVAAAATPTEPIARHAADRLGVILKAYTVYLDIWLCDLSGRVIANGRPGHYGAAGKAVRDRDWFRGGLSLADGESYAVAEVAREPLLGNDEVATYVASIREGGLSDGRPLGLLAIHFDWAPQARAIVRGVRLTEEERATTRVLLADGKGLVLAASDDRGILSERLPCDFKGRTSGVERDGAGTLYAFHRTPGYETYPGQGWYGVIQQTR